MNAGSCGPGSWTASAGILLHWLECIEGAKCARPRPDVVLQLPMFGEWLSLVEHLVRDQGVGGSNPLSPTILSHLELTTYAVFESAGFHRFSVLSV